MDVQTYRGILGGFGLAALESHSVTLVLKTLGGDETLDAGCLGIGFLALALWLDFAADDEFADLTAHMKLSVPIPSMTMKAASHPTM